MNTFLGFQQSALSNTSLLLKLRFGLLAFLAILVSGCASQKIDWDYDNAQVMTSWKSYAWIEQEGSDKSVYDLDGLYDRRVRSAIDREMQARGFRLVEKGDADFLVNYFTDTKTKREEQHYNTSLGYGMGRWGMGMSSETRVREYEEGSLVIDFVNPDNMELVWRGRSRARIEEKSTPEKRTEKINAAVAGILDGFPPGAQN